MISNIWENKKCSKPPIRVYTGFDPFTLILVGENAVTSKVVRCFHQLSMPLDKTPGGRAHPSPGPCLKPAARGFSLPKPSQGLIRGGHAMDLLRWYLDSIKASNSMKYHETMASHNGQPIFYQEATVW